jgi:fluoride ion exporter CrcB/FEX
MDGTDTIYGPQVGSAIFGYLIGISCAISSCICGSHFVQCLRQFHPWPPSSESENFVGENVPERRLMTTNHHTTRAIVIILSCIGLFGAFIVADARYKSMLYRELWLASFMAPLGAVIRWRLRALNARPACTNRTHWFPWGTFAANFVASIISILATALKTYIVEPRNVSSNWIVPILVAVNIGFTGSLSTASSLAHELLVLETLHQSYCYAFATIVCSMLVSVMIYIPIARFG